MKQNSGIVYLCIFILQVFLTDVMLGFVEGHEGMMESAENPESVDDSIYSEDSNDTPIRHGGGGGTGWPRLVHPNNKKYAYLQDEEEAIRQMDYDTQVQMRYDDCWYGSNYDYKLQKCVSYLNRK